MNGCCCRPAVLVLCRLGGFWLGERRMTLHLETKGRTSQWMSRVLAETQGSSPQQWHTRRRRLNCGPRAVHFNTDSCHTSLQQLAVFRPLILVSVFLLSTSLLVSCLRFLSVPHSVLYHYSFRPMLISICQYFISHFFFPVFIHFSLNLWFFSFSRLPIFYSLSSFVHVLFFFRSLLLPHSFLFYSVHLFNYLFRNFFPQPCFIPY